jgi:hypothetical protein
MNTSHLQTAFLTPSFLAGENLLAFDMLELKACCNTSAVTQPDEVLCALSADQLIGAQTQLCLGIEDS